MRTLCCGYVWSAKAHWHGQHVLCSNRPDNNYRRDVSFSTHMKSRRSCLWYHKKKSHLKQHADTWNKFCHKARLSSVNFSDVCEKCTCVAWYMRYLHSRRSLVWKECSRAHVELCGPFFSCADATIQCGTPPPKRKQRIVWNEEKMALLWPWIDSKCRSGKMQRDHDEAL